MRFTPFRGIMMGEWWDIEPKSPVGTNHTYPYIAGGYGVWVNEIGGFDLSVVKTGPTSWTEMTTERAREMCGE